MMLPKALPVPAVSIVAALAVTACDVNIHNGKASFAVYSAEATDEWTHHYSLAAGGRIEVVNRNGPIELNAGNAGVVDVHTRIIAKALTEAAARQLLAEGKIQETVEADHIHIETTVIPRGLHGSYEVQYEVHVPADAQVDSSTTNGSLKADGLSGKLKATAVNGRINLKDVSGAVDSVVANGSLEVTLARVTAPVRLEINNGRLSLQLRSSSRATLSARIVNGAITVSGLDVDRPAGNRIKTLEANLNGGGPEVTLRATNGRISIQGNE